MTIYSNRKATNATLKEFGPRPSRSTSPFDDQNLDRQRLDVLAYGDVDEYSETPSLASSSSRSSSSWTSPPSSPRDSWKEFGPRAVQFQDDGLPTSLDHMQDVYIAEAIERKRLKNRAVRKNRFNRISAVLPSLRWSKDDCSSSCGSSNDGDDFARVHDEYLEAKAECRSKRFDSSVILTL
jgi:hypothetical protein